MSGSCKAGLGLLEVIITIAILALVGTIAVPLVLRKNPRQERRLALAQLNGLVGFARQRAIMTGKQQKLEFRFPTIRLLSATDKKDSDGNSVYEPVNTAPVATELSLAKHLEIKQFIIDGKDEMGRFMNATVKVVWFFVMPSGVTQAVVLNIIDKQDGPTGSKGRQVGWVLNPFCAQFKEYDEFQK